VPRRRLRVVAVALRNRPTSLAVPSLPPAPASSPLPQAPEPVLSSCPWPRTPRLCCWRRACRRRTSGEPLGCARSCCPCPRRPSWRRSSS
jgi:hypothetical protein